MRVEKIGRQTLILADCRDVLPTLGSKDFDAIVCDPPFGLGDLWQGGGGKSKSSWKFDPKEAQAWDQFAPEWLPKFVGTTPAIVWGGNYMPFPLSRAWLVWDKGIPDFTTGHSELAWTNLDQPIRNFKLCPNVMTPTGRDGGKQRPTQKPIALMEWCLGFLPNAQTILDPFAGSFTTAVACQRLGRQSISIELDPDYYAIGCRRVQDVVDRPPLFLPAPPKPTQDAMDL